MEKGAGEKEVYVDFSDEVVEEEVVQSGATEENTVPTGWARIQESLPPVVVEYVERFKESYERYRKQYLVGLAIFAIVVLVVSKLYLFKKAIINYKY